MKKQCVLLAALAIACGAPVGMTSVDHLGFTAMAQANSGKVTGVVKDSNGEPLIGVTVKVKGTNIGTVTDLNGNYSIKAGPNQTLEFSYIGYDAISVPASQAAQVVMLNNERQLDEVVVTAEFGMKRVARTVGSSVQNVKAADIVESGRTDFISALQGRVSGMNVISSGGAPGASTSVVLRSATSLSGNNQPLYVVDGIPMNNTSFNSTEGLAGGDDIMGLTVRNTDYASRGNDFNPEDIESMTVLVLSFVLIAAILYGLVPGIVTVGGGFELFFVNSMGMPFNTGLIVYIIVLVAIVIWAIYETYTNKSITRQNIAFLASIAMLGIPFYGYGLSAVVVGIVILAALWFLLQYKKDKVYLVSARVKNTALLCMLMLMIGYSSYALIVIRSDANPPMDQNSPEDIFTLGSYLSRDQYGDSPLVYGQAYTSQVAFDVEGQYCKPRMTEGAPVYQRKEKATPDEKDSYFIVRHKSNYKYAQNMLFPRMHDAAHAQSYEQWMQGAPTWVVKGTAKDYDRCGEIVSVRMPSQLENLFFFFSYQCNFMYWRYFMWNFAGRQNDVQGNGELEHGNWITGIPFIDNARLGNQDLLPDELKENKGHNVFFCLPLIIGLIGLFWQAYRGKRGIQQFWVVFFLFFMTGLAIVIYLNQTPVQPRERDYAYAGSFYAYAIWCGIGVAALYDLIKKHFKLNGNLVAAVTGGPAC